MNRITRALLLAAVVIVIILAFGTGGDGKLRPPERRSALTPFRLASIGGPYWALDEQRGEVVLLNFWATWCPPCRMETPELVTLAQTYGPRGLRVVGISMDEDPLTVVPPFVKQYRIPYPILIPDEHFGLARSIASLPTTFLLDRKGRMARLYTGARDAEEIAPDVERLLAEK